MSDDLKKRFESVVDRTNHPSSQAFLARLVRCAEIHAAKQSDYGTDRDPFANLRGASGWGIRSWVGACVRMQDKVNRLKCQARRGSLANESAHDAFLDLAVYALIADVLYSEEEVGLGKYIGTEPDPDVDLVVTEDCPPIETGHNQSHLDRDASNQPGQLGAVTCASCGMSKGSLSCRCCYPFT